MKVSLLEPIGVTKDVLDVFAKRLAASGHTFVYYDTKTTDKEELKARSKDSDIVIIANNPFPNEVVEACENLKMINVAFTGIDHVGLEACKRRNIMVCNAAGYSGQTVAELTIGLTIAVLRNLPAANAAVRDGGTSAGFLGSEIAGKTVGIIGTGNIGLRTALLFRAFGADVIAYSRTQIAKAVANEIRYVPLDTLLAESDIISLHLPLNAQTKGMIGEAQIAKMKPTAVLINCARGPIVDNMALTQALNTGRLAGAGIDVFDMEPPISPDYPLLRAKNTVLTPHIAYASHESMLRRADIVFENAYCFLRHNPQNVCAF